MKKKKRKVISDTLSPEELAVLARRKLEAVKRKAKAHRRAYEANPPKERKAEVIEHTNIPSVKKTYTLIVRTPKGAKLRRNDGVVCKVSGKKYLRLKAKKLITIPPPPKPERVLPKEIRRLRTPRGFHAILCGDDRVTIMDTMNAENKDVMCYHHRMGRTLHLLTRDLRPRTNVFEAILYLRGIKETLKE